MGWVRFWVLRDLAQSNDELSHPLFECVAVGMTPCLRNRPACDTLRNLGNVFPCCTCKPSIAIKESIIRDFFLVPLLGLSGRYYNYIAKWLNYERMNGLEH